MQKRLAKAFVFIFHFVFWYPITIRRNFNKMIHIIYKTCLFNGYLEWFNTRKRFWKKSYAVYYFDMYLAQCILTKFFRVKTIKKIVIIGCQKSLAVFLLNFQLFIKLVTIMRFKSNMRRSRSGSRKLRRRRMCRVFTKGSTQSKLVNEVL